MLMTKGIYINIRMVLNKKNKNILYLVFQEIVFKIKTTKYAGKLIGPMYHFSEYFTLHAILYFYKCQIRPKIEYRFHICEGTAKSSLSSLHIVQKCLRRIILNPPFHSHRRNVANLSLLNSYIHEKYSDELHS